MMPEVALIAGLTPHHLVLDVDVQLAHPQPVHVVPELETHGLCRCGVKGAGQSGLVARVSWGRTFDVNIPSCKISRCLKNNDSLRKTEDNGFIVLMIMLCLLQITPPEVSSIFIGQLFQDK